MVLKVICQKISKYWDFAGPRCRQRPARCAMGRGRVVYRLAALQFRDAVGCRRSWWCLRVKNMRLPSLQQYCRSRRKRRSRHYANNRAVPMTTGPPHPQALVDRRRRAGSAGGAAGCCPVRGAGNDRCRGLSRPDRALVSRSLDRRVKSAAAIELDRSLRPRFIVKGGQRCQPAWAMRRALPRSPA